MGYLSLLKLLQLPLGTIALVCMYVHITYIDRHVRFERREIWSRLLKITYHTLHFKLMVSKNKIPILAKIVDLGSYLKVFTGIKKKNWKKKFFLCRRKFVFWTFFRKIFFLYSKNLRRPWFDLVCIKLRNQSFGHWCSILSTFMWSEWD